MGQGQGLEVIGAGLGRTGTLSYSAAMTILGYKVHHFIDISHSARWADWAEGRASNDEMVNLIAASGYTATCDNPSADLFAEQMAAFPEAKVVLMVRDSPAKWAASWRTLMDTLVLTEEPFSLRFPSFLQAIPLLRHAKLTRGRMGTTHLGLPPYALTHGWREKPAEWLEAQYEAHNQLVMDTVPAEKLLVFNAKEGWEPLCAFLGKEVPAQPFPHVNDSAFMRRLRTGVRVVTYAWIPATLLVAASLYFSARSSARAASSSR